MNIPVGVDNDGLPIGIQLMADYFKENDIFEMSKYIQNLN